MNPYRDNFFHHMIFSCNNFHSIAQQLQASRVESLDSASAPLNNFVAILANCFRAVNWMNRIDWLSSIEQLEPGFVTTDLNN